MATTTYQFIERPGIGWTLLNILILVAIVWLAWALLNKYAQPALFSATNSATPTNGNGG